MEFEYKLTIEFFKLFIFLITHESLDTALCFLHLLILFVNLLIPFLKFIIQLFFNLFYCNRFLTIYSCLDHLDLAFPWVGGHGFGGSVARIASIAHPGRFGGLLLLGVEGTEDAAASAASEVPENARKSELVAMQRAARAAPPEVGPLEIPPGIPILIIQGADDEVAAPANGEALATRAPERISVVTIEGARDLFPLTHVGETAWPIEDYLDWD